MQAVAENNSLKLVKEQNTGSLAPDTIENLLNIAENSDPKAKSEIENKIVSYGTKAIPQLIARLQASKGTSRGIAAMSLIRIGFASIEPLKAVANVNAEFNWIAEYLIGEIEGSKTSILAS